MQPRIVCFLPLLLGGCYSYAAVPPHTIPEGARTSIALSTRGSLHLEPTMGANLEELEGTMLRASSDSVEIYVTRAKRRGVDWTALAMPVVLPSDGYSQVRKRQFSPAKSALVGLGVLGAIWLGISTDLLGIGQDRDKTDPGPGPPNPGQQ